MTDDRASAAPADRRRGDRGSATVWVLAGCVLLLTIGAAVFVRTTAVLARHRAEMAADLAALAAAGTIGYGGDACAQARAIAADNRARVADCRVVLAPDGRSGAVTVRVTLTAQLAGWGVVQVAASARAGRSPPAAARP